MPDTATHLSTDVKQAVLQFIQHSRLEDFPPEIVTHARYCLLDLIGVAAAGRTTPTADIITDYVAEQMCAHQNSPAVPLLFDGRVVSPTGAALAGATIIDAIDAHDGFRPAKGHAGCSLLPALLAALMARDGFLDEEELLCCLIIGYEIGSRAAMALHASVSDYHTSGAWGAIAVAAVTARVEKLSDDALWHAMGIAEYHGPRSQMMRVIDFTTMLKDGSGWGSCAGLSATALARRGFTGAPAICIAADEVAHFWQDLGSEWLIMQQYFKPWAVCRWAQPAMQAVLDILPQIEDVSALPAAIEAIHMEVFHEALRLATPHPQSEDEAQYSLCWPVAALLIAQAEGRKLGIYDVSSKALARADIHALADKITLAEEPEFNAVFPEQRWARVTLTLLDGRTYTALARQTKGDPETPLTYSELEEKFEQFMLDAGYADRADAIKKACLNAALPAASSESHQLAKWIFS